MLELFADLFSYSFMSRAMIVGVLVALCSALLGVSLVLKRYSMIGDGLSHVGFGALSVAVAMNVAPLQISIPVVVIAAFLLLRINSDSRIKGDAAIALISSSALAIGVIVTSLTTGLNADVHNYLFGSIPVSYTHLDVYKRQLWRWPWGRISSCWGGISPVSTNPPPTRSTSTAAI